MNPHEYENHLFQEKLDIVASRHNRQSIAEALDFYRIFHEIKGQIEEKKRWEEMLLAALSKTSILPEIFLVPAPYEVTRTMGGDPSVWLIGYNGRKFLRLMSITKKTMIPEQIETTMRRSVKLLALQDIEMPFALPELKNDQVFEVSPSPEIGEGLIFKNLKDLKNCESYTWYPFPAENPGKGAAPVLERAWVHLIEAYLKIHEKNDFHSFGAALKTLLLIGEKKDKKPRHRVPSPWQLLMLHWMAAEIFYHFDHFDQFPHAPKELGMDDLLHHPLCFKSLKQKLSLLFS